MTSGGVARIHAFGDDALGTHDAVALVEALHAGRVSIPEVAGMPTMEGTDAWTPSPALRDGEWAKLYLATGLIPLGKSRLSEFGFSPSAEHPRLGAVRCPWDLEHTAGASSAGAAAMVAAGVVPIAHANDGGGSIRIPASVNGLVGLKPTRGWLPQERMQRLLPVRIISDGVLTRSVRDTAAFLRESERIYRALRLPPIGELTRPGRRRLRIGVTTEGIGRAASPEVTELTLKVAVLLEELGHHVEPVRMPAEPAFADDFLLYWSAMAYALVRGGRRFYGASWDPSRLDNLTLGLAAQARRALHRIPAAIRGLAPRSACHRGVLRQLRRGADPDAGHGHPAAGLARPDPAVRGRDGAGVGLGGVHTPAERHR